MPDRKIDVLCRLLSDQIGDQPVDDVLVVGCGSGHEAAFLADYFSAKVVGIDLGGDFDPAAAAKADLRVMDATDLELVDDSFDLIYSFHALEHIDDPVKALAEMERVIRPGGWFCVGTPNRSRLIGYLGSPTSLPNKVRWNLQDLGMRLRGKFRNEEGAHAGFTSEELAGMCQEAFGQATEVTDAYYAGLYGGGRGGPAVRLSTTTGLSRFIFPCVYFTGQRA
ncbi:MAG: class I SAM-dependent methyltransferase [Actinomycetota bacterium]